MTTGSWDDVQLHEDGQPLLAEVLNGPLEGLTNRTDFVRRWLEQAAAGNALRFREAPVATNTQVGSPVYLNRVTGAFELASAAVSLAGELSDSGFVWGIVTYKYTASSADILVNGLWQNAELDSSISGTATTGAYYLSATAGMLTSTPQPMQPFVLYYDDMLKAALVLPHVARKGEEHIHQKFDLAVVESTAGSEGWRAVVPEDAAPEGAAYVYVYGSNTDLEEAVEAVAPDGYFVRATGMRWNVRRAADAITVTTAGIWWMFSDEDWEPFGVAEEPAYELWITNVAAVTRGGVLSLQPATGSGLSLKNHAGESASSGNLVIDLDPNAAVVEEASYSGPTVLKAWNGRDGVKGKVVGSLKSGSPYLTLTGADATDGKKTGDVTISYNAVDGVGKFLAPSTIVYGNANQMSVGLIPYHALPHEYASSVAFKYDLPGEGTSNYETALKLRLYADTAGTLPNLTATAQVVQPSAVAAALPAEVSLGAVTLSGVSVSAPRYIDVLVVTPTVRVGSTIVIKLQRASGDSYAGNVGIIHAQLRVIPETVE